MALMLVSSGLLRAWCQLQSGPTLYAHENQSISLSLSSPTLIVSSGQGTLKAAGRRLDARHDVNEKIT